MRHLFITIIAIVAVFFETVSCQSALDIDQHGVASLEKFYKTDADAEQALTSVYFQLRENYSVTQKSWVGAPNPIFVKTMLSDEVWSGGGNHFDGTYYKFNDYTYETDHASISSLFSSYYKVIYTANLIISKLEDDTPFKKQAIAEAKVLRAFQYMDLILFWGTPRLVDHPLAADEYLGGNTPTSELWAFVEKDLTEAINSNALISKTSVSDKEVFRVTKEFAQALLGKAYVFQEKYDKGAQELQKVIDSNKYKLTEDLYNIWTVAGECNEESILEINILPDLSNYVYTLNWMNIGLRSGKYINVDNARAVPDDTRLCDQTWGYANPTKVLYDKFMEIEGKDGYRRKCSVISYEELKKDYNKQIVPGEYVEDNEGYFDVKLRVLEADYLSILYPCNIRIMRLAEVYLLAAEAYYKSGNVSKATSLVNDIRRRAKAPEISGNCTFEDIQVESQLELCFEGQRYENLIRWKMAADVLKDRGEQIPQLFYDGHVEYSKLTYSPVHGFKAGKHELFPFPASETQINDQITQNPNW